mmetsp:Transcript_3783/g.8231  ORF Transcript_3783/g.8231 Transcript_3783/m.8231 type:complete len:100 (-) Transcript_3783:539-838(-)
MACKVPLLKGLLKSKCTAMLDSMPVAITSSSGPSIDLLPIALSLVAILTVAMLVRKRSKAVPGSTTCSWFVKETYSETEAMSNAWVPCSDGGYVRSPKK